MSLRERLSVTDEERQYQPVPVAAQQAYQELKKSMATMSRACAVRKARHVGDAVAFIVAETVVPARPPCAIPRPYS